jgi:hypothetical protein
VKRLILILAMLALPLAAQAQDQQIDASAIYSSGDITMAPAGGEVLPDVGGTRNLGTLTRKWGAVNAAELWVETLVAQDTMATIGGRVLVAPTTSLVADLTTSATTIHVKANTLASGDRVVLQSNGNLEWMAVTSSASGSAGNYSYSVTRNLDGSGANTWSAGDAVLDTGASGDGYIDLYSVDGLIPGSTAGPTIVGNVRTGTTWSAVEPRWAIGNLEGLYGYSSATYGAAFGDPDGAWLKVDASNGVRIGYSGQTTIGISSSGAAQVTLSPQPSTDWDLGAFKFATSTGSLGMAGVADDDTRTKTLALAAYDEDDGGTTGFASVSVTANYHEHDASTQAEIILNSSNASTNISLSADDFITISAPLIKVTSSGGANVAQSSEPLNNIYATTYNAKTGAGTSAAGVTKNCDGTAHPFTFTGGIATACTAFSDLRKKHDVEPFTRGLSDVLKIRPIAFRYNADVGVGEAKHYGFNGQNLLSAIPEAMSRDKDGFLQISYSSPILATYANAIRELAAQLDELKWEMEHTR